MYNRQKSVTMKLLLFFILYINSFILSEKIFNVTSEIVINKYQKAFILINNHNQLKISNPNEYELKNGKALVSLEINDNKATLLWYKSLLLSTNIDNTIENDKCSVNNGNCDINSDCILLKNDVVQCICKDGFIGNGKFCTKVIPIKRIYIIFFS